MYQVNGEEHVRAWLSSQGDLEQRIAMLDWLPVLAADPEGEATARRLVSRTTFYVACVPNTSAIVDYYVVKQFNTVVITKVAEADIEDE